MRERVPRYVGLSILGRLAILAGLAAMWALSQSRVDVASNGNCSAAIVGNSNRVTLSCDGLSREKADDLVRMMNLVIRKQLDAKKVYAALDSLDAGVRDLSIDLNVERFATPAQKELLGRSNAVIDDCGAMLAKWSEESGDRGHEQLVGTITRLHEFQTTVASINSRYLEAYSNTFARRLETWQAGLKQANPALGQTQLPSVHDYSTLVTLQLHLSGLARRSIASSTVPRNLAREGAELHDGIRNLAAQWSAELQPKQREWLASQQRDNAAVLEDISASNPLNSRYSERFRSDLAPRIKSLRVDMAREFSEFAPFAGSGDAIDLARLPGVCSEVQSLAEKYKARVAQDRHDKAQVPAK